MSTAERTIHHPLQRDTAVFLETAEESGGIRTLLEVEVMPGGGTPPHRHRTYAEAYEVLDGELTVVRDGEARRLGPGRTAVVPARSLHWFANRTDAPATFRVELRPGHRGFERTLQVAYGLAADGLTGSGGLPRDPYHAALLLEQSEMELGGPLRVAAPVLRRLAARARRAGIDRELAKRYVRI